MLYKLLGSKLRAKVLAWFFTHTEERYFVRRLESLLKENSTNISRELVRLESLGILTSEKEGKQKYYRVDKKCPIFAELKAIVLKTIGLRDVLAQALVGVTEVKVAFVYGSLARGSEVAQSDVDLMVIGPVSFAVSFGEVVDTLQSAQEELGREINPTVMDEAEFRERAKKKDHFITTVLKGPKLFVLGSEDELKRLGG